jgi:hypothetical protein
MEGGNMEREKGVGESDADDKIEKSSDNCLESEGSGGDC